MKKLLSVLFVVTMLLSVFSLTAFAAQAQQDGVTAVLTADKGQYADSEAITATLTVTNTNNFAVTNVSLESLIPDGYVLAENNSNRQSVSTLAAGEFVQLAVTFEPIRKVEETTPSTGDDEDETSPTEESTIPPAEENTTAPAEENTTDPAEETTQAVTQQPSTDDGASDFTETTTAPVLGSTQESTTDGRVDSTQANDAAKDSVVPNTSDTKSPQTGDNTPIAMCAVILFASAVVLIGINFRGKKNTKALMSIALCVTLLGSTLTVVLPVSAAENEATDRSFTLSETVNAGESLVTLTANVSYTYTAPPEEQPDDDTDVTPASSHILIAYFSRVGNTDYPDDVDATTSASIVADKENRYGTTEYMAREIQKAVGGDLHLIETADPYSTDFDEVVDQNHNEISAGELPTLKPSHLDIDAYDTVFIGYPVWATTVPRAVLSFMQEYDLSGKTVIPFCTHDGYGAGTSYTAIAQNCPDATYLNGLAIQAKDIQNSTETIYNWLDAIGIKREYATTDIRITADSHTLDGVFYDTALAKEILQKLPLTVSMVGYGGREYYGGLDFTPSSVGAGQLNFEDGDITYCPTNNTLAIFYAQTDRPNLTMEVIPIGKVTSDLSVFNTLGSRENITFALPSSGEDTPQTSKRVLVAYFSATGNTKGVSQHIGNILEADLYEITPEIPYTAADLNYGDSSSRTSIEMNDPNARPAISGSIDNMDTYDVVFLGYPIWWGEAPRIINTFLESYDFSGKTIIPFCTSGSSGIGSSATNLHSMAPNADWLSGRRFSASVSESTVAAWINELNLDLN